MSRRGKPQTFAYAATWAGSVRVCRAAATKPEQGTGRLPNPARSAGREVHRQAGHLAAGVQGRLQSLVGERRRHPDVDDEVLKDLIAQTLHMDRGANGADAITFSDAWNARSA